MLRRLTYWLNRRFYFSTVPHALPKVPFCTNKTACATDMVTVNWMARGGYGCADATRLGGLHDLRARGGYGFARMTRWNGYRELDGAWRLRLCRRIALGRACGTVEKVFALVHSPPVEGWQAKPDGVVVKVLNNVTPIDLLAQSAVLFFNSPMLALPYGA